MSNPYIGQITIYSFNFAPKGWAMCNGQLLPINQNQALFSLLGTTYGGDGRTTFALPNLQGRVPLHMGKTLAIGANGGEIAHLLTVPEMPTHSHNPVQASTASSNTVVSAGAVLGAANNLYTASANPVNLAPATIGNIGGGQPHDNMQPYLSLNICIALVGLFPPRN